MFWWLSMLACSSGAIDLDEEFPRGGSDTELMHSESDTESVAPTDTESATDTERPSETETETESDPSEFFEGEYIGDFAITVPEWGDWTYCSDVIVLEVDSRLRLESTGDCRTDAGNEVELELSGEVDEDGVLGGSYVLTVEQRRDEDVYEGDFKGAISGEALEAGFTFELEYSYNELEAQVDISARRR